MLSEELIFKILLLGDGFCGKTSMRYRYMGQDFTSNYLATLGADFAIKENQYKGYKVRYQIWDIAGQQRFNNLRKSFYLGSQGALIVFDLTNRESLTHVLDWAKEFWENNGKGKKMPIIVVGNKVDLRQDDPNCLSTSEAYTSLENIRNAIDYELSYIETSALTGENINTAFETITDFYLEMSKST